MANTIDTHDRFFRGILGICYHFQNELAYPHGRVKAIRPYRYNEEILMNGYRRRAELRCMISFTDGYIGDYTYTADTALVEMFKGLKKY